MRRACLHPFGCKCNFLFNCVLHLHMHHIAWIIMALRHTQTHYRHTAFCTDAQLCKSAPGETTARHLLIRSRWQILMKAIFYCRLLFMLRPRDKYAPLRSKQSILLSRLVCILKGKTCLANLSDELRSDQQNANAQLIQCTYAAFPYQTLWSMLRPCPNAKLSISPVKKKKNSHGTQWMQINICLLKWLHVQLTACVFIPKNKAKAIFYKEAFSVSFSSHNISFVTGLWQNTCGDV